MPPQRLALALAFALVVAGCRTTPAPTPPGPRAIHAQGTWIHAPSSFAFPDGFGKFRRIGIEQFDPEGRDVGVTYELNEPEVHVRVTLYVRPPLRDSAGRPLAPGAELESWKEEVLGVHPDARVSSPWTPPRTQNHEPNPGNALAFRFTDALWGEREEFESLLYVFEYDGWIPTYRISYPSSQHKLANLLAQVFVQAFKWRGGS